MILATVTPLMLAGCVAVDWPGWEPPAEAVLAGTWELVQDSDASLSQTFWVFDEFGKLIEMRTKIGPAEFTQTAIIADTEVNEDNVVVQLGFSGNQMSFQGTFNEDQTRIEGSLSTEMSWGGTTVTIDGGAATLVKQ